MESVIFDAHHVKEDFPANLYMPIVKAFHPHLHANFFFLFQAVGGVEGWCNHSEKKEVFLVLKLTMIGEKKACMSYFTISSAVGMRVSGIVLLSILKAFNLLIVRSIWLRRLVTTLVCLYFCPFCLFPLEAGGGGSKEAWCSIKSSICHENIMGFEKGEKGAFLQVLDPRTIELQNKGDVTVRRNPFKKLDCGMLLIIWPGWCLQLYSERGLSIKISVLSIMHLRFLHRFLNCFGMFNEMDGLLGHTMKGFNVMARKRTHVVTTREQVLGTMPKSNARNWIVKSRQSRISTIRNSSLIWSFRFGPDLFGVVLNWRGVPFLFACVLF